MSTCGKQKLNREYNTYVQKHSDFCISVWIWVEQQLRKAIQKKNATSDENFLENVENVTL